MFMKLHRSGEPVFVNMSKVYDFHPEPGIKGTRLHFDTSVAPEGAYGPYDPTRDRRARHWSIRVDEAADEIMDRLVGVQR